MPNPFSGRAKAWKLDGKRRALRESLWPGSEAWIWGQEEKNAGYVMLPRLIPLVLVLIRHLSDGAKSGDPSSVYFDLWCRCVSDGIVTVKDEQDCAYSAGYTSNRAVRTWRGHMLQLHELRFILAEKDGNREYGQILLLNPLAVCVRYHEEGKTPEGWWGAFTRRATEIGADLPPALVRDPHRVAVQPKTKQE